VTGVQTCALPILLRPDPNTGKVHTLLTVEVFGIVRSLMAFRLTGGTKGKGLVTYLRTLFKLQLVSQCGTPI
jgi:hypothetical protein